MNIRIQRADADLGRLDDKIASVIKGMLKRGDKQSDIAACFLINGGRIAEINTGQRFPDVKPAIDLPPVGPYPSPYELWKAKQNARYACVALETAAEAIQHAIVAVGKVKQG